MSDGHPGHGSATIHVVAALVTDAEGLALMVRKRGTTAFMQPGGKPEPGEEALQALRRELSEELGLTEPEERYAWVGRFVSDAANEPGHQLIADVWRLTIETGTGQPAAEIAEHRWIDPYNTADTDLAPLSEHVLLPLLRADRSRD